MRKEREREKKRVNARARREVWPTLSFSPSNLSFFFLHPSFQKHLPTMSNPVVFFDVTANDEPLGRIEMTVRACFIFQFSSFRRLRRTRARARASVDRFLFVSHAIHEHTLLITAARRRRAQDRRELPRPVHG
jgi:hypothetical protein